MTTNADQAKCLGRGCNQRQQCERYLRPAAQWQVYADFYEDDGCRYYIEANERETRE